MEDVALADRDRTLDARERPDHAAAADGHVRADDGVRADLGVVCHGGVGADERRRMNVRHYLGLSTMMLSISASATTLPSTVAVPLTLIVFERRCSTSHSIRS